MPRSKKDADISFLLCRQGVGIEAECIPITTHLLRVRLGQRANEEFEFPKVVFGLIKVPSKGFGGITCLCMWSILGMAAVPVN